MELMALTALRIVVLIVWVILAPVVLSMGPVNMAVKRAMNLPTVTKVRVKTVI